MTWRSRTPDSDVAATRKFCAARASGSRAGCLTNAEADERSADGERVALALFLFVRSLALALCNDKEPSMDRDRPPELLALARGIADAFESGFRGHYDAAFALANLRAVTALVLPALLFLWIRYVDPSPEAEGIDG